MKEVLFEKMNGAGNDFIMINDIEDKLDFSPETIRALCAFHTGIGADGLIMIKPSTKADFGMRYFNSDGSEAELCGNGARCVTLFAYNSGLMGKSMSFDTASGIMKAEVKGDLVSVEIGDVKEFKANLELDGVKEIVHCGICGVPHAAVLVEDVRKIPRDELLDLAKEIRFHDFFSPKGTNVNFVSVEDDHTLSYRTYERGVEDETLACGTGAVTISVIFSHLGLTESPVKCKTSSGDVLEIQFDINPDGASNCILTGPAVVSFKGSFDLDVYQS